MLKIIFEEYQWRKALFGLKHDWYHTWDYHQIAQKSGEGEPVLISMSIGDDLICMPLLVRAIDDTYSDATSVYGYSGVIFSKNCANALFSSFLDNVRNWATENNIVSIFSRLNTYIDGNISQLNQLAQIKGETVSINLSMTLEEQRKRYRKNYRNLINKLSKDGFTCSWSNNHSELTDFIRIYNSTMVRLNASNFYFFNYQYFSALLNSNDFQVRIYSCYYGAEKACSGLFVFCGNIVQYHLSGTVEKYSEYAPTRLMIDTVRQDATALGYSFFHLGGGAGDVRDSLFDFKFGFSKETIDFRVLKLITNHKVYAELSGISEDVLEGSLDQFFPLYRKSK